MTPSDLITTLLVAGFSYEESPTIGVENPFRVNLNGENISFEIDSSYRSVWRYRYVTPYDLGAIILADGRVLVLHEPETPNQETWEHHYIFNGPKEAWDFIRNFLQEHP